MPARRTSLPRLRSVALGVAAVGFWFFTCALNAQEKKAETEEGLLIAVSNPINEPGVERIKRTIEQAMKRPDRPVRTIVLDFNPDGKEAATENYGMALNLAEVIRNSSLKGARSEEHTSE